MSCITVRRKFLCERPDATNITRVTDQSVTGGHPLPGGVIPYLRQSTEAFIPATGCPAAPTCAPGDELCGEWRPPNSHITPDSLITTGATPQVNFNAYSLLPAVKLRNACCPIGYKNLQSRRQWHGVHAFNSEYWQSSTGATWPGGIDDTVPTCQCRAEQMTPDQTKYRTLGVSGFFDQILPVITLGDASIIQYNTIARQVTVGELTGVTSLDVCSRVIGPATASDGINYPCTGLDPLFTLDGILVNANRTLADYIAYFLAFTVPTASISGISVVRAGNTWTASVPGGYAGVPGQNPVEVISCDFAGTFSRDIYSTDFDGSWIVVVHEECSLGATSATFLRERLWHYDAANVGATAGCLRYRFGYTAALATPNTFASVRADAHALLATWDLKNDIVYPYRTDDFLGIAPLVTRSEMPSNILPSLVYPSVGTDCLDSGLPWVDPRAAWYNGSVIGAPGEPGANAFDWNQQIYWLCGDGITIFPRYFGMWNREGANGGYLGGTTVPAAATQWTWNYHAQDCRAGRWEMLPGQGINSQAPHCGDGLLIQEWREIRLPARRQNWARPCGLDAYLMDELTVRCIDVDLSPGGDDTSFEFLLFNDLEGSFPVIIAGDLLVVYGAGIHQGLWTVDSVNTGADTVTAHWTADLPAGFTYSHGPGPLLGKRRYPTAGGCNATWNNTTSSGNWVRHTWRFNSRDFQERDRVIAYSCSPCTAGGAAIRSHQAGHGMPREVSGYTAVQMNTPIGDCVRVLFPEDFPASLAGDACYGTLWQSAVQQWMPELYGQTPHKTCQVVADYAGVGPIPAIVWTEDFYGQCLEDDPFGLTPTYYYPSRDWVEAELAVPSGAPAVPAGIYVGYLSLAALDTGGTVNGNVAPPPGAPGFSDAANSLPNNDGAYGLNPAPAGWVPWGLLQNQCVCIDAAGRFAVEYTALGVRCG